MQVDFFQVLRRVQKEERSKSSLANVESDFYKQLRNYIKDLERSVASDPFGNEQLLLNNAQRIATEICEIRESKITKAANNNIYRSFLLFKKDNPQFDLLDTTPLNLTPEEETLYFSLMDVLKNHRYRISLDEYVEESISQLDDLEEDLDADEEAVFVEDSYDESNKSSEEESGLSDDFEDEISKALGQAIEIESSAQEDVSAGLDSSNDDVLGRLDEIKNAKVISDEKYENIDKQVANQMYPGEGTVESTPEIEKGAEEATIAVDESNEEIKSGAVESSKPNGSVPKSSVSNNVDDFIKNPDSQFVDLNNLEPNYEDDYYNSIAAGSNYAAPSDDDFNMIFAKPKKPKVNKELPNQAKPMDVEKPSNEESSLDTAPKKIVDKTRGGLFSRDEIENTAIVINENLGEIVGIDGKVYGPFLENDFVILPNITAQILIDNNKASLVKL